MSRQSGIVNATKIVANLVAARRDGEEVIAGDYFDSQSLASLPPGGASIWRAVRPLDSAQRKQSPETLGSKVREIPIAIEGVVVILNPKDPVADFTVGQLRAIFTGEIANWKQVGGNDAAIHLCSTEAIVGGSLFFTDFVLHGEKIDTTIAGL